MFRLCGLDDRRDGGRLWGEGEIRWSKWEYGVEISVVVSERWREVWEVLKGVCNVEFDFK